MEVDELYTLKNAYWMGNYEEAIAEAKTLRLKSDALRLDRDVLVARANVGLGNFDQVLGEIKENAATPSALRAVRILAAYLHPELPKAKALATLETLVADSSSLANPTVQYVAAILKMHEGSLTEALRLVKDATTLEQLALSVQLLLRIDRPDLAEGQLKAMATIDDESALTQLSTGFVYLALGGDKYKEASLVFKDLYDRHGPSSVAINGLASAYIAMRRFDDADKLIAEALAKDSADADALVNSIAVAVQTGREAEVSARLLPALREAAPSHAYVQALDSADRSFDRIAAGFGV